MRRGLLCAIAGGACLLVVAPALFERQGLHAGTATPASTGEVASPPLAAAVLAREEPKPAAAPLVAGVPGLDLTRIAFGDGVSTVTARAGTARLTLDSDLQRTAVALMKSRHLPEAAVVLMDVASGRLLVYASHVEGGPNRDLCVEATAPSASVFKIVTAAALIEDAHLGPDTRQCYLGGERRIGASDLVDDPLRDKWCTTLAGAMGRSINAVFARLAKQHLAPQQLEAMARRFGYGQSLPFDVPVEPSAVHVPSDPLEFARTAAGFWNTTLSPLEAAEISAIVARGGESVRPSIVDKVVDGSGAVVWSAPDAPESSRAIASDTADKVGAMMEHTISEGTSFRAFHDAHGEAFLPGLVIAGKTGTLTAASAHRYYTWFTGFAPMKPTQGIAQIAVAVLVVNGPTWQVKANVLARDVLRAYFASRGMPRITRPTLGAKQAEVRHRIRPAGAEQASDQNGRIQFRR
jgi:peptidoglycan glycosyltransferase